MPSYDFLFGLLWWCSAGGGSYGEWANINGIGRGVT